MKNRNEIYDLLIIRYLDGDLSEAEKIQFNSRLNTEVGFSERYELLKKNYTTLKAENFSIPEDYINAKLYQLHSKEKSKSKKWSIAFRYSIVFSVVLIALIVYYNFGVNGVVTDDIENYAYYQTTDYYNDYEFYTSFNSQEIDDEFFGKLLSVDMQSIELFYRIVNPYKDEFEYLSNEDIDYIIASLENKKF